MNKRFAFFGALSIALAGLVAIGCNKFDSVNLPEFSKEIGIRPMGGAATRSAINSTAFPQGYDMLVSAYRNVGDNAGEDVSQNYFEGIQFAYDAVSTSWKSTKGPKYYPLDGTLDFLAVASAGYNTASNGIAPTAVWGESSNVAKKVVLTVPANNAKFDDLLYGASNAEGVSASGTGMTFKHAMTSVVFVAKCNVAYNAETNTGITIDGITIDGAKYSGTLTISNPSAGGGSGDLSAAWSSLGDAQTHVAARVWNVANLGTNASESALSGLHLTTTAATLGSKPFGEAYVILPPQAAVPFTITYTIHNGKASDGTTNLSKQVQYQVTPEGTWDMGKKNVFEIDFNLTEILINPDIVDWDAVDAELVPVPMTGYEAGHQWIDLGLRSGGNKILFAATNIGAANPEDYGTYFAWGATTKNYTSISGSSVIGGSFDWDNCPFETAGDGSNFSKYTASENDYATSGTADGLSTLATADDVAHVQWGGNWRMPDKSDLEYLVSSSVTYEWTSDWDGTGVAGLVVTGKGSYSGNSIFLPAAGFCDGSDLYGAGGFGGYWSRSLFTDSPGDAWYLCFADGDFYADSHRRCYGRSVRPVLVVAE